MGLPKLFFNNRFADGIPVASSTATGNYAAANIADMRPYTWWKANALPASITVDCGSAKAADYALIYGHDLFAQGATLEVRGSTDNFSTSNVLVASHTPTTDDPFLVSFASASYRYWRIMITGAAGNKPVIAIAMIGVAFVMPDYLEAPFDPVGRDVQGRSNISDNGWPLGSIIDFEQFQRELNFGFVGWSWIRATWLPAWKSDIRGKPFVFGWNPDVYPGEIYLVAAGQSFNTPHEGESLARITFSVKGVVTT